MKRSTIILSIIIGILLLMGISLNYDIPFISTAVKHIGTVGALTPISSRAYTIILNDVEHYVKQITTQTPVHILELGGGTGTFTERIIQKFNCMNREFTLDVIEMLPEYCIQLEEKFQDNKNITIYCLDAATFAQNNYQYDIILCTLPFNSLDFSAHAVQQIFNNIEKLSHKNSLFIWIEYAGMSQFLSWVLFGRHYQNHMQKLQIMNAFSTIHARMQKTNFLSMPPVRIYEHIM